MSSEEDNEFESGITNREDRADQEVQLDEIIAQSEEVEGEDYDSFQGLTPTRIVISKKDERSNKSVKSSQKSVKNNPVTTVMMDEAQFLPIKSKNLYDNSASKENKDLDISPQQIKKVSKRKKLNIKSLERIDYPDPYLVRPKPSFVDNKESYKFLPIYKKLFLKVNCPDIHTKLSK